MTYKRYHTSSNPMDPIRLTKKPPVWKTAAGIGLAAIIIVAVLALVIGGLA